MAGLDLWDAGKVAPVIVATDLSGVPEQTRVAVWSDVSNYGAGTKGKTLVDAEANTDVTQAKVNTL